MRMSRTGTVRFDGLYASFSPAAFPGADDVPGYAGDESESDWDEVQVLNLIERDGLIRAEDISGDWE